MQYKLKTPCKNCPYRKDLDDHLKGWLGRGRAEELAREVLFHGNNFPCHKTTSLDGDSEDGYVYTDKESQCAGAGIMQLKANNPSQWMQVAGRMGWDIGVQNLDLNAPVFDTAQDFIEFHTRVFK
ncbi:hypothetical protein KTH44_16235 [Acinetobacter bereziniae]|uniref:hypothetical protein n=1 Tax=Acinetobacter bereziniae TaxID=106648 RepID=UPI0021CD3A84|nr:hypothetical protein [Acinetobacter bereziniae]MCU4320666.1 hypothetical protein [Acinetobacter bereziniae]